MTTEKAFLTGDAYRKLVRHLDGAYPQEGCGVLLGVRDEGRIETVCPVDNQAGDGTRHGYFVMDPLELYRIERQAEEEGLQVMGFYHSHPDSEAVPSCDDIRHMIPEMIYIIRSTDARGSGDMKGYIVEMPFAH